MSEYDQDIVGWSTETAEKLRQLRSGKRVNDLDWDHLIEEVEALGRSELRAVESLIQQTLIHLLKMTAWPNALASGHWMIEIGSFVAQVQREYQPAMAQRIDVDAIYTKARKAVLAGFYDDHPPANVPDNCPISLNELLDDDASAGMLARKFSRSV